MYTLYDYAYNGYLYLNNIMRPRHKRLSQLMSYSTTACQCFATNLSYFCGKTKFFLKKVIKKQPLARSGIVATGSLAVRFESVVFTFIIEKCSF